MADKNSLPQPVLILAAGLGTRMGGPKALTRFGRSSFLERILARAAENQSPVVLTLDARFSEKVKTMLHMANVPLPPVVLAQGEAPMLDTIQAAFADPQGQKTLENGGWIWPVDAPLISPKGWKQACEAGEQFPEWVIKLRSDGKNGHPVWLPSWAVKDLTHLKENLAGGLRGYLATKKEKTKVIEMDGEVLVDLNTIKDLESWGEFMEQSTFKKK